MSDLDRLKAMNAAVRRRDSLLHQELAQRANAEGLGFEGIGDEFG